MRFWNNVNSGVKNIMAELTIEGLTPIFDEIKELVSRANEIKATRSKCEDAESVKAYELVYNDFLWKIQRRIGQLHFFVCGFDGFPNPLSS